MRKKSITRKMIALLALCLLANLALAQRPSRNRKPPSNEPPIYEVPKNQEDLSGRFTFARIRFNVSMYAGYFSPALGDGGPPWSHDYPIAGRHLMKIMTELSKLDATTDRNEVVFAFDEPELFKYPLAYLCEVGFMRELSDKEIAGMREYCLRGGFLIVDDFRGRDWYTFAAQVKRAFPEYELKPLALSHPIFNCFFSIKTLEVWPNTPGADGPVQFFGLADATGRLMMIANYNYDASDFWQWSNDPFRPIEETNEAYKFGVNYIIYALTH
jgi:hypothetical protein